MEIIDSLVVVRALKGTDELVKLNAEAGWDDHTPVLPTHVFEKSGELAGYASVGALTPVNTWFHTKRMKARDSIIAISSLENMVRCNGGAGLIVPLSDESPFLSVMGRFNYTNIGRANLMVKVF
jgi:hypothetical protein